MTDNKPPPPFNFVAPPELHAEYANLVRIAHSPVEFVLEFARLLPGEVQPLIVSKVVMTPLAVKMLHRAITENIARFEGNFGEIVMPGKNTLADQLFRPSPEPEPPKDEPEA